MADYMVIFRLPLLPRSKLANALGIMGWQSINENVYSRSIEITTEDVIRQIKLLCRNNTDVDNGVRTSAFTVTQIPRGKTQSQRRTKTTKTLSV